MALAISTVGFVCASAQPADEVGDAVDAFVEREMKRQMIPGLSIGVLRAGELLHVAGYGVADVENDVAAKPETVYQSGSVAKPFTAMAVMLLVEDGKLALEDPIGGHLGREVPAWEGVRVEHLLAHTSGIPDYLEAVDLTRDYRDEELVEIFAALPLSFEPGEQRSYSNSGYVLLGMIIERISGLPYAEFLKQRMFEPLGMSTARGISEADIIPNRSEGYGVTGGRLHNAGWVSPSLNRLADGGLYLTVPDVAKLDAALYGEELLSKSSIERMWSTVRLPDGERTRHGLGWQIGRHNGRRYVGHSGGWQGFTTQLMRFLDDELTVIVLCNLAGAGADAIAVGVAALFEPALAMRMPEAVTLPPERLAEYVGMYELGPHTLRVHLEDGGLVLVTPHERVTLEAASEVLFFTRDGGWVRFQRDEAGAVTRMIAFNREAGRVASPPS